MRKKQQEATQLNIAQLEPRTMEQALGERCMELLVDMQGYVCEVDQANALFGPKSEELVRVAKI